MSGAPTARWTPEVVWRFWDYLGTRTDLYPEYFSNLYGEGIVKFIKMATDLSGQKRALDYGCGPGFLVEHLLRENLACTGLDFSEASVHKVNERFATMGNWRGAHCAQGFPIPFGDGTFDLVTCVETLEHMEDAALERTLQEIRRVLTTRGTAVFTVPNEEDLYEACIMCPFCGVEFHRVQHVRSFTGATLATLLEEQGFSVLFCDSLDFAELQPVPVGCMDISLRVVRKRVGDRLKKMLDTFFRRPFPHSRIVSTYRGGRGHLTAIAVKASGSAL
jgi:SAM-dependent methyltransferase